MNILMTGGTGFLGKNIIAHLLGRIKNQREAYSFILFTRNKKKAMKCFPSATLEKISFIESFEELLDIKNLRINCVLNLAGEPIFGKLWNEKQKAKLYSSRVTLTQKLIECIGTLTIKPDVFISASAIGIYGMGLQYTQGGDVKGYDEDSLIHPKSFMEELCYHWEQSALVSKNYGIKTYILRIGLVLDKQDGLLKKMLPIFRMGLGGKLGDGTQMMSWVHLQDLVYIIEILLSPNQTKLSEGIYNLVAPEPVTNANFSQVLAKALKRPNFFQVPSLAIKTILGEMGESLLLSGVKVIPKNLVEAGYDFKFKKLNLALEEILRK